MKKVLSAILILLLMPGCTSAGKTIPAGTSAFLSFDSFDGGGPDYSIVLDSDIVTYEREKKYAKEDHEELEGAGFTITYTFTGVKPGEAVMTVEERSPIGGDYDHRYKVKVDEDLNVTVEHLTTEDLYAAVENVPTLVIVTNDKVLYATLEDNSSADEFAEKLSKESIEVEMLDYSGELPWMLESNDEQITTEPGDVILFRGNQISINCDHETGDFTRLAKIEGMSRDELLEILGDGNATVYFWVEWSE